MIEPAPSTDDLRALVSQVAGMSVAGSAAEGIDRLRQFEMLQGALSAAAMREALAIEDERGAEDATRGLPADRRGRGAAGEVGLARRVSPNWATHWLRAARELRDQLPETFAQLAAGATSERRALSVVRETNHLTAAQRGQVDTRLAPQLEGWGDRRVEGEARRMAQLLDPAGAVERARRAERERRVTVRPAPDTMTYLTVLLPMQHGVAAYAALRKHADTLITMGTPGLNDNGTPRTRDQIMSDIAFERLTGRAVADGPDVEVTLVMSDQALLHQSEGADEPARLQGLPGATLPAPLARTLALGAEGKDGRAAKRWIRRLYLTPDGTRLAAMDSRRRIFPTNAARYIRLRDQDTCRTPWCDAPIRASDHIRDHAEGGPTSVTNGEGYCTACNLRKQAFGWRTVHRRDGTITTITPTGHRYRSPEPTAPGAAVPASTIETELRRVLRARSLSARAA